MNFDECDGASIAKAVRAGEVCARDVAIHTINRVNVIEPKVHAFAHFSAHLLLSQADALDNAGTKGRLAGMPIGVKDIFDTADLPTEYNSPIYRGRQPSRDCPIVARLRKAGALIVGKTETAEFAYMRTGPTRNPHGLERTPGSSSAGSAAGIGAGLFAAALGTQTGGSVIKPASYCGAFALKPTYNRLSLEGVKPLAPSFDTAGWFGRSVDDLRLLTETLLDEEPTQQKPLPQPEQLRLAVAKTDFWGSAQSVVHDVMESLVGALRKRGYKVTEFVAPFSYQRLAEAHGIVNDKEGARSLAYEYEWHRSLLSDLIAHMIERGRRFTLSDEADAKAYITESTRSMDLKMKEVDAIITPATAYEAPVGLGSTGSSDFIKTWTALGVPQLSLPVGYGENRMPIGIQLVGGRWRDTILLQAAKAIESALSIPWKLANVG